MNKLLERQIKRIMGNIDAVPPALETLFKAISDAYDGFDADRRLIEHALDMSSEELRQTNQKLSREVCERKDAQEKIKNTLSLLTATLESTADGILVVDLNGRAVSYNQKFLSLWRIPDKVAESKDDNKLLAFVLDQLIDPQGFLAEVQKLYAHIEEESFGYLKFKDGRVFERFSQPQRVEETIVGRVWSFRNITERMKAELHSHRSTDY
jgi:PAS domain-containing protein